MSILPKERFRETQWKNALAKAIVVIAPESGREISRMPFAEQFVSKNPGCSFDGRYFFACYLKSGTLVDLETGTLVRSWSLKHHHAFPAFSPQGSTLALCEDRDISLWEMSSGEPIGQLPPHPTAVLTETLEFANLGETRLRGVIPTDFDALERILDEAIEPFDMRLYYDCITSNL